MREVQSFVCGVSDAERKHRYIVLVARHWIRLTEIADIRLYERSSIYRLHRRNLICNREFLIQPLTAKSILQLDWVINYYRLYNAVSLFFSFLFFLFPFIFNFFNFIVVSSVFLSSNKTLLLFTSFPFNFKTKTKKNKEGEFTFFYLLARNYYFFSSSSFVELLQTSRVSFRFFFFVHLTWTTWISFHFLTFLTFFFSRFYSSL